MDVVACLCHYCHTDDARAAVASLCAQLVAEVPPQVPVPIRELARLRGIRRVDKEAMGPGSKWWEAGNREHPGVGWGAVLADWRDGTFRVVVERSDPEERQRFSLAHELVHTFFAEFEHQADEPPGPQLERLCDFGAAELLMPAEPYREAIGDPPLRLPHLERCANLFKVSLQAAAYRAVSLSDERIAVAIAEHNDVREPRDTEATPRITRVVTSVAWRDATSLRGFVLPSGSPMLVAFNRRQHAQGRFTASEGAELWAEAVGYVFEGGRLDGHRRSLALLRPSDDIAIN